jgi:L-amino acid N-acyltransferase YncA
MTVASADVFCIRDLTPDDWTEVAAIYYDGMRDGLATFETEVPSWEKWHAAHTIRVVAELDERVIGWAALGPVSSRWSYRGVPSRASTSAATTTDAASAAH